MKYKRYPFFKEIMDLLFLRSALAFLILIMPLSGCKETSISLSIKKTTKSEATSITINQAVSEDVGTCHFLAANDPTDTVGFSYRITFSNEIDSASFTVANIENAGTGGGSTLAWLLTNCGDNKNFKLATTAIVGDGTIVPRIVENTIAVDHKLDNSTSTSTDNSVTFISYSDTTSPTLTINQSISETVGTCSFSAVSDPTNAAGFSYRVTFSEGINAATFTSADIYNAGTGGATTLIWTITNCGDDTNFKLTATAITGNGTIIPQITANSLQDVSGNNNSVSTSTDNIVTYDTVAPTLTINQATTETVGTCSFASPVDPSLTDGFSFRVTFSEIINTSTFTTADIYNAGTGGATAIGWTIVNCGDDINFKLTATTITGNGTIVPQILGNLLTDLAGNNNAASTATDNSVAYDSTAPNVTINQATTEIVGTCSFTAPSDPTNSTGFSFRVTFSEAITTSEFTTADIVNAGSGGATTLSWSIANCGDDTNFNLTATAITGNGTIIPQILSNTVLDTAGNNNTLYSSTDNTITYDTTASTITINQATTQTVGTCSFTAPNDPTSSTGFSYRVTFSEAITTSTFTTGDITNTGTGGATALTWAITNCGDDTNFKLAVSAITGNGTIIPTLASSTILDVAGNNNSASTATDNTITYDTTAPTLTVNQATTETVGTCSFTAPSDPANAAGFSFKVTFSESISTSTLTTADIYNAGTGGGTAMGWTIVNCGDDTNFKLTATTITGDGTILPQILGNLVTDVAGNNNAPSTATDNSVTLDTTAPSVTINQATTQIVGSCSFTAGTDPTTSASINYRVTFSEAITSSTFTTGDIVNAGNGGATALTWSITNCGDDTNFKLTTTAITGYGSIIPQILASTVTDVAGNNNSLYSATDNYVRFALVVGWIQEAYIKASNANISDAFGSTLALNGDTLVVGVELEDSNQITITNGINSSSDNSNSSSGAVYVYKRTGSTWIQEAYIKAANSEANDLFGASVALYGDTLAVGAYQEDSNLTTITSGITASSNNTKSDSGAVYVYTRSGGTWSQEAYIKAVNNDSTTDSFGKQVAIGENTIAVSSPKEDGNQTSITNGPTISSNNLGSDRGAVYVYTRSGTTWAQEAYIKPSNNSNFIGLGSSSLELDGDTLAVGTESDQSNQTTITNGGSASTNSSNAFSGAVYIYKRYGTTWAQDAYIKASNSEANDYFGCAISLSGDTLVVGAWGEDSNQTTITNAVTSSSDNSNSSSGAVYVYKRTANLWSQEAYIKAANNATNDNFGSSLSLNGNTLIVSSKSDTDSQTTITNGSTASYNNSGSNNGSVFVYNRVNSAWIQDAFIKAVNSYFGHHFGTKVSLSGDTLAVSATGENSNQITITNGSTALSNTSTAASGAVYIYRNPDRLFDVSHFVSTGQTTTSITLAWHTSGSLATGYKIAYALGTTAPADCTLGTVIDAGNVLTYAITGLSAGQKYSFRICSYDFQATLAPGYTTTFFTQSAVPEITNLSWVADSNSAITLTWVSGGGATTGYKISYSSNSTPPMDCNSGTVVDVGNVLTYQITGFTTYSRASFRVCSYDVSSNLSHGLYTTTLTGTTSDPTSLYTTSNSTSSVTVNWTSGGGGTTGFKVSWATGATTPANCTTAGTIVDVGSAVNYTITGLSSGQAVRVRVCSYDNSANDISAGATVIGASNDTGWNQEAYIKASNSDAGDNFGYSLSLHGDTLAVGAYAESSDQITITNGTTSSSNNLRPTSGAVYVYKRSGSTWVQEAYIKAVNSGSLDNFGYNVSLHKDTLAVGAISEDSNLIIITNGTTASSNNSRTGSGAVYVYKRTGSDWAQEAYIKPSNNGANNANNAFGGRVAVNADTIAVSTYQEDSDQTTITNGITSSSTTTSTDSGAVYIYKRSGSTWAQEAYIKASNNNASDYFGFSLSLNADTLAVGANQEDSNQTTITNETTYSSDNTNTSSGAVYVYKRSGTSWAQEAYVKASNSEAGDAFGYSVSINGETLAVGANGESSNQTTITNNTTSSSNNTNTSSGAAYLYKRSGSTWAQEAYIKTSNNGSTDGCGISVSLNADTFVLGCDGEDSNQTTITNASTASSDNSSGQSGAAYVYERTGSSWSQEAYIKSSNSESSDNFATAVSVYGDTLAVGSYYEDSNQTTITNGSSGSTNNSNLSSGAVYIYRNNARLFDLTDLTATATSSTVTLSWVKTGGTAIGYFYAYQAGATAPADCQSGTWLDAGNISTDTITGLSSATTYSFRVCANSDGSTFTAGTTISITTP